MILYGVLLSFAAGILGGCASDIRYSQGRNRDYWRDDGFASAPDDEVRAGPISESRLEKIIASYIGVRYQYGGTSRRGVDCSGLVFLVFNELNHSKLPRSTERLNKLGTPVRKENAKLGDLVFFRGGLFNLIDHVGIYIGSGKFVHASSSVGVTYANLDEEYFSRHYAGTRRIF